MSMEMEAIQSSSCESDQIQLWKFKECEPENYENETHHVKIFDVLQSLRKDQILCDIRLQTDDGTILFGHKVVLVSASPYFYAMLTSFEESSQDLICIKEFDSTALQLLIDYIYTGKITITKQNVQVLLPAANLLQFDYVKSACVKFMKTSLNPSNCFGIKEFADLYNCIGLLTSCDHLIKNQFLEIVKYDEFLSLSVKEVIDIISSNDLAVRCEEKIFECVINWVKYDLNDRYDSLPKLLEHVRLPLAPIQFISEKVVTEPLLKNSPECKDYVIEAFNFHALKTLLVNTIPQTIRTTHRRSGQVIIVFSNSGANWYDPAINLWQIAPLMSNTSVVGPIALIKQRFMFSVGATYSPYSTKSVFMLDLSLQSPCWVTSVNMNVERIKLDVGVLNECIYAVGGVVKSGLTNSAEVFDSRIQKWRMISSMSTARCNFGIGILNNRLYAVGGKRGLVIYSHSPTNASKSVECYDPSLEKWSPVAEMSECREGHGIGVLDGAMYAIGGNNGSRYLKSVEVFRLTNGAWLSITDMHTCRTNPRVFVLEGLLYVIGGRNEEGYLDSMEIYNPNTNTWSMEPLLKNMSRQIIGGVVVDKPSYLRTN